MAKNIVVFSDGTGQEGGKGNNTNVYKLFNMIEDRTNEQVAFYDPGLGTGWRRLTGKAFGLGIRKNITDCYRFIFENYEAGDRIFLFGFSRGATTVRSLSSLIHYFGILPKSRPELIKKAHKIYRVKKEGKRKALAKEFVGRHHTQWAPVHFLGVWDTVAALGIPIKTLDVAIDQIPGLRHRHHNLRLSGSVKHARHALSIDDERLVFHPTIWDTKLEEGEKKTWKSLKQVWFAGMHSDVGGGYAEEQLSDIALDWMLAEATSIENGLRLYKKHEVDLSPNPNGIMHDSRSGQIGKLYRPRNRSSTWNYEDWGAPAIHESVLERNLGKGNVKKDEYKPWILNREYEVEPWLNAAVKARYAAVQARKRWNETPFNLEQGKSYKFFAEGTWVDSTIATDAKGFALDELKRWEEMRRVSAAKWFSVVGAIDRKKESRFDIGAFIDTDKTYTATKTGTLHCYANDVWLMYFNNKGKIRLRVEEVAKEN